MWLRVVCWLVVCGGLVWSAAPAGAQRGYAGGKKVELLAQRLVRVFDFEETNDAGVKIGAGIEMPRHWYVVGRDPMAKDVNFGRLPLHRELGLRGGYPGFNRVHFDRERVVSGDFSLKLSHQGGDVGAFVEVGALPAVPMSDYLVTAKVRTRGLEASAVYVLAYLVDARGNRLGGTVRSSGPVRSEEGWAEVDLPILGEERSAAYVGIEVHLAQPGPRRDAALGGHAVTPEDVRGEAWVDDVALWQLPTVELHTQSALNTFKGADRPRWTVQVRDMVDEDLRATVRVFDASRRLVAEDRRPIRPGLPTKWEWSPALPGYGWYLTELRVGPTDGSSVSSRTWNAVLWMPEETLPVDADARRLSLSLEGVGEDLLPLACGLFGELGFQRGVWSVWDSGTTVDGLTERSRRLDRWLSGALGGAGEAELSFTPIPAAIAERLGVHTDDAAELFSLPAEQWQSYVQPTLLHLGTYVRRWRMGGVGWYRPGYAELMEAGLGGAERNFREWTASPRFTVPLPGEWPPTLGAAVPGAGTVPGARAGAGVIREVIPGAVPGAVPGVGDERVQYAPLLSAGIPAEQFVEQLEAFGVGKGPVTVRLEAPDASMMPHPQRIAKLMRQVLEGWRSGPGLVMEMPLSHSRAMERRVALLPDPLLGVYRNALCRLAGRRVVDELRPGEGVMAWVFDGPGGGMLAAWNERASEGAELRMYLGPAPVAIDAFGNRRALQVGPDGMHTVELGDTPLFIEDIDVPLMRFRAGMVLNEPFVESLQTPHERTLRVTNPWNTTINGRLTFIHPEEWDLRPARHVFSLAPGRTLDLPVTLRFPVNEPAGDKRLSARLELQADKPYDVVVDTPMHLGLRDLAFEASVYLDTQSRPGHTDAVVSAMVTNTSGRDVSLNLYASHPRYPYAERLIPELKAGQTALRTFRFPDTSAEQLSQPLMVGVRETAGPAMLNRRISLDDLR